MKKAIVIGATSGMGRELAILLAADGYRVGITGRRTELLEELKERLGSETYVKPMDIARTDEAMTCLKDLIEEMEHVADSCDDTADYVRILTVAREVR